MSLWTLLQVRDRPTRLDSVTDDRFRSLACTSPHRTAPQASLLVCNAGAILNEKRVLNKCTCYRVCAPRTPRTHAHRHHVLTSSRLHRPPAPRPTDGLSFSQLGQNSMGSNDAGPLKQQIIGMLHAATYMRMPLVVANLVVIVLKLLIG